MNTKIQFLGHATFRVTTPEGKVIIVDPWLVDNPFIPDEFKNQDKIDMMIITHGHDDHFDNKIVDLIDQIQPKVIANSICRWHLLEQGVLSKLIEPMNIGGTISLLDVKVTMVNAFHLSHINITDTKIAYPHASVGYIIHLSDGVRIYFAGDTSIFGDMKLIADIYRPTVAVLPIGDRFTMGPLEASHAIRMLNVKHVIPFHYGTYPFLVGTPKELTELTKDIEGLNIHALKAGEVLDCSTIK